MPYPRPSTERHNTVGSARTERDGMMMTRLANCSSMSFAKASTVGLCRTFLLRRWVLAGLAATGVCSASPLPLARAEGGERERAHSVVVVGVAPGFGSYKGKFGPWFELFVGHADGRSSQQGRYGNAIFSKSSRARSIKF